MSASREYTECGGLKRTLEIFCDTNFTLMSAILEITWREYYSRCRMRIFFGRLRWNHLLIYKLMFSFKYYIKKAQLYRLSYFKYLFIFKAHEPNICAVLVWWVVSYTVYEVGSRYLLWRSIKTGTSCNKCWHLETYRYKRGLLCKSLTSESRFSIHKLYVLYLVSSNDYLARLTSNSQCLHLFFTHFGRFRLSDVYQLFRTFDLL